MTMGIKYFVFILVIFLTICGAVKAEENPPKEDIIQLENRVKQILKQDNVSMRKDVDEVFALADIYVKEGRNAEAVDLYATALQVDSWRLEYQLKLARLINQKGDKRQAVEKAKIVQQYAEDEELIVEAENFLSYLGVAVDADTGMKQTFSKKAEIILIPIGAVNKRLLSEMKKELQVIVGIKYSILEGQVELGEIDRSYADLYLTKIVDETKSKMPPDEMKQLLADNSLKSEDLNTFDGKLKFVEAVYIKSGYDQDKIDKFIKSLRETRGSGQFDASKLLDRLEGSYKLVEKPEIKGYLGIMSEDIFSGEKDNNFLFGLARKGYAVMSYSRFMAKFNNEPPNRPRLIKRMVKQGISSSFFILDIQRCTTPTCARAYPHSLTEHDQKDIEICPWCKAQLDNCINETWQW
jgi:predicted Zn-dependent protease